MWNFLPWWLLRKAVDTGSSLLDGLVSYWPLDEISGVRYDAVGSNDLTDNNTVGAKLRGPEGTAAKTVYANSEWLGRTLTLDYSQGVTLSIWFYQATGANVQGRFAQHGGAYYYGGTGGFSLSDGNSTPNLYAGFGDNASIVSATTQSSGLNSWHHVVMWYDPADKKARMRLDGQAVVASASGLANHPNPAAGIYNDFVISRETVVGVYTDGQFGPTGLWNRLLTTDEQDALFADGNGARYADIDVGASCIGWWELDEVSGVRYDSHGSNDLTDNNTVGSVINAGDAMDGAAASFVAANSEYLSGSSEAMDWSNGFTVSIWAKKPVGGDLIISKDDSSSVREWTLIGDVLYTFQNAGTYNTLGIGLPADDLWHHVLFWFDPIDGLTHKLLDNTAPNQSGGSIASVAETSQPIFIGRFSTNYHSCVVDEFAIWSRVLTADERAELYNLGRGKFYDFS